MSSELLCDDCAQRFGIDTRGLRLPGLISHVFPGFSIDYEVDPVRQAIAESWPETIAAAAVVTLTAADIDEALDVLGKFARAT